MTPANTMALLLAASHRGALATLGTGVGPPSRNEVVQLDEDSIGTTCVLTLESGWVP